MHKTGMGSRLRLLQLCISLNRSVYRWKYEKYYGYKIRVLLDFEVKWCCGETSFLLAVEVEVELYSSSIYSLCKVKTPSFSSYASVTRTMLWCGVVNFLYLMATSF